MGVRVTGVAEVRRILAGVHKRTARIKPFLDAEAVRLAALIDRAWAERRGPDGAAWAPYDDADRDGGGVQRAHQASASGKRLTLRGSQVSAFHYYGTQFMPARNPTPFERIVGGYDVDPTWLAEHAARLRAWLISGDESGR